MPLKAFSELASPSRPQLYRHSGSRTAGHNQNTHHYGRISGMSLRQKFTAVCVLLMTGMGILGGHKDVRPERLRGQEHVEIERPILRPTRRVIPVDSGAGGAVTLSPSFYRALGLVLVSKG